MKNGKGCILIVDDSSQDAELITAAFEQARVKERIIAVRTADAAESYFSGKPPYDDREKYPLPKLVLLDIQMPGRDGFSFLAWLRGQDPAWHRLPVIMLTTSHDYVDIRKSYDMGANSFLVKPTGFDELCKLVKSVADYWIHANRFE